MNEKIYSHIWSSYTIKAFCKLCDHFDVVEEGDFVKLVQHLESHRTVSLKEEVHNEEATDIKNENIYEPLVRIRSDVNSKSKNNTFHQSFSYNEDSRLKYIIDLQKQYCETNIMKGLILHC